MKGLIINLRSPRPCLLVTMTPMRSQPKFLLQGPLSQRPSWAAPMSCQDPPLCPGGQGRRARKPGCDRFTRLKSNRISHRVRQDRDRRQQMIWVFLVNWWISRFLILGEVGVSLTGSISYVSLPPPHLIKQNGRQKHHDCLFLGISRWL